MRLLNGRNGLAILLAGAVGLPLGMVIQSATMVTFAQTPEQANPGGGINGATGYRYWTISVANLEAVVAEAKEAGYQVPWEPREIRAGVSVAMVEDPDGNWVELLQRAEGAV